MNEKRLRFEKVAGSRVNKVRDAIEKLEKCSNTYNYEYYPEDVKKMLAVIKTKFDEMKLSYSRGLSKNKQNFKF
ncbi:hypothetical protein N9772_05420 [Bacteroidia bacterium]|nr:hypothetical protein [Bacteroidia bacterium]